MIDRLFWSRVDKNGPTPPHAPGLGQCWVWTGATNGVGYGKLGRNHRTLAAHRYAWRLQSGREPVGHVLHRCDNPPCVRKKHLFEGDDAANQTDMVAKGRRRNRRGTTHPRAKVTEEQVAEIRKRYRPGLGRSLAREYGLTQNSMWKLIHGETWKHVTARGTYKQEGK